MASGGWGCCLPPCCDHANGGHVWRCVSAAALRCACHIVATVAVVVEVVMEVVMCVCVAAGKQMQYCMARNG